MSIATANTTATATATATPNSTNMAPHQPGAGGNPVSNPINVDSELKDAEECLDTTLFRMLTRPEVSKHIKWAGRKDNYHTLSTIRLYQRKIAIAEDHGLHLLWKSGTHTQFIKPLPEVFATQGLDIQKLGHLSRGFLFSYTRLIQTQHDYEIAKELKLLPVGLRDELQGWTRWKTLADTFWGSDYYRKRRNNRRHAPTCTGSTDSVHAVDCPPFCAVAETNEAEYELKLAELLQHCHPRYKYGDLRMGRVDWIVRLNLGMNGWRWKFYQTRSPRDSFIEQHSTLIAAYVFYVAVILTAMQVSLAAFPNGEWTVSVFGIFGYIVIVLTALQVPIIVSFFLMWLIMQLAGFWLINHKESRDEKKAAAKAANKSTI